MSETNSQRVAKNTGFLFIRTALVLLVGLYTSRVVLKTLGFEDFGLYNVVGSVVVFFSFLKTALTNATYRYLAYEIGTGNELKLKQTYSMAINCHAILAACLWIILELGGVWFLNHKLNIDSSRIQAANWAFQFSLLTFCISIIQTPYNSNIIAHEKMDYYALISIVEVILKLAVVFLLTSSPIDKLIAYTFLLSAVTLIILICYIVYCRIMFKECCYIRYWDGSTVKKFASYSGWSLLVNIADVTTTQSISIFFNLFLGVVTNAALGIANQVIGQLNAFLNTFTQAFNPQIIKSYAAKKYDYFMKLIYSTSKISYFLLLFISLPIVVNIDFVLKIWLGNFPVMTPYYIQAIIIYSLIDSFQAPLWQAVHATGKLKIHQILMASIKIMAIPFIYIALKSGHSGITALIIWAALNLVCAAVRTIYMRYLIGLSLKIYMKEVLLKIILVTVIAAPLPYYIVRSMGSGWLSFLVSSFISIILISGVGYFMGLNKQEKNVFINMPIIQKTIEVLKNSGIK